MIHGNFILCSCDSKCININFFITKYENKKWDKNFRNIISIDNVNKYCIVNLIYLSSTKIFKTAEYKIRIFDNYLKYIYNKTLLMNISIW